MENENENENDIVDDSDDYDEYICPLNRSNSFRTELLEIPTPERIQNRMKTIKDISGQFVEDVNVILEKCGSSYYVIMVLSELTIDLAKKLKGEKDKITVDTVKEQCKLDPDYKSVDAMHIFHAILSRELPAERISGIIHMVLTTRPSATTDEIEDSLRYLYGSGPYAKVPNIPPLPSKDLTVEVENINNAVVNAMTSDKLKSIFGLRPQVIDDFSAMFEKFPHDNIVTQVLYSFVTDLVENLHGDTGTIDAIYIRDYAKVEDNDPNLINAIESIFSTRLDAGVYCGLINLMKAFCPNTSVSDIEKALEYLYGPNDGA